MTDVAKAFEEQLTPLARLVALRDSLAAKVEHLRTALKEAEAELRKLEEGELLDALDEMQISSVAVGADVAQVREALYMSIPKKNMAAVADFLSRHGFGALVTTDVAVHYGRDSEPAALALLEELQARGVNAQAQTGVNTGRAKAAVRELLAEGVDVPMNLFGAYLRRWVDIKSTGEE